MQRVSTLMHRVIVDFGIWCFLFDSRDLARIEATVVEKTKTPKVIVFKKKRRKGYKRTQGINECLFRALFFEQTDSDRSALFNIRERPLDTL